MYLATELSLRRHSYFNIHYFTFSIFRLKNSDMIYLKSNVAQSNDVK
jgi:hypothetical protein